MVNNKCCIENKQNKKKEKMNIKSRIDQGCSMVYFCSIVDNLEMIKRLWWLSIERESHNNNNND